MKLFQADPLPWTRGACALALILWLAPLAAAQTETGRITGVVTDSTGGLLPGASVTARAVGTGAQRTLVTDENGQYVIANLPPGTYEVAVALQGFKTVAVSVPVVVGGAANVNVKLELGGLAAETVNVTAESPAINTVNSEIATIISESQIRELPTITRNVYDLVGVAGNVTPDDQSNRGTGFAINGLRSASTNILLDGSANNDEFTASVGQAVPLDSVQEFSVVTSNFSAQYGRASGGVVNVVTKTGTNAFRGTAYEFYRDDKLATNTFDNKANELEKGAFTRHQMGFSVGGPIKRDRVHFFTNLEYIRVRSTDTTIGWVPTPELLAASAAPTRAFFSQYGRASINGPILSRGEVSGILGAGTGAFSNLPAGLPAFGQVRKVAPVDAGGGDPQDNYQWVTRADYSAGNTQFYVRYAYQNQEAEPGTNSLSVYDGYDTGYLNHNHNLLGSMTHVFSSTFTSQTKVVWNRLYGDQPLNGEPLPALYMNPTTAVRLQGHRITFPGYLPWGPGTAIPFGGPQQLLQLYQDQTKIWGNHDVRFGGSYVRIGDDRTFGAYANAVQALNRTSAALPSLDNFVLGQLGRFQSAIDPQGYPGGTYTTPVGFPSFNSKNKYNEFGLYVNDNWKVKDRLTLNLGMRYEYFGPQTKSDPKYDSNFYYGDPNASVNTSSTAEIINAIASGRVLPSNESPVGGLWKADWNNFAPRVGFAWDVNGDGLTSIRGGYGIGYERNFGNVTYNVLFNPPEYLVTQIDSGIDVPVLPIYTDNQGPFGGIAGVTKTIPAGSLRHVDQNIETAYAHFYGASFQRQLGTYVASVEYSGSSGRKLYDLADPNKAGAALVYTGVGTATSRPLTQYGAFNTRGNRGRSQYHGITLGLDSRQIGKLGLQFSAKYTYGQAKDNLSSTFSDSTNNFNLGYLDAFDPMLDYGYAGYDVRHRGTVSGVWILPFARDSGGLVKALAADWQLNFIFTARSGFPFTVFDCTNATIAVCMRVLDPVGIDKNATDGPATSSPNEFTLLDLARLVPSAGSYVHPLTGNSEFGPWPSTMTERDAFRGPGLWNVDFGLSKRVRFGANNAVQFRIEAYNVFNHPNMFVQGGNADISSFDTITGFKDGNRRIQLGLKFEF